MVRISGDHWGIPTPTLDALKNRSIPPDKAPKKPKPKTRWDFLYGMMGVGRKRDEMVISSKTYKQVGGGGVRLFLHLSFWESCQTVEFWIFFLGGHVDFIVFLCISTSKFDRLSFGRCLSVGCLCLRTTGPVLGPR